MSKINCQIGKQIRTIRKSKQITLEMLSQTVHKCKSTLSKYETGEISMDIDTLYEIADALGVSVNQLLWIPPRQILSSSCPSPGFFSHISRFFSYVYDGRSNLLIRCVFDILAHTDNNQYQLMMYMNVPDLAACQKCENTYQGYMEHYDAITNIQLTNQNMPMEKASIKILASSLDTDTKWGLFCGFSSRPMMPIATKMLFSRRPLREDSELIRELKISKTDIRLMKLYNMFPVI